MSSEPSPSPILNFANYGKRLIAFLIDGLIAAVISVLLLLYLVLPPIVPDLQERMQNFQELTVQASSPSASEEEVAEALQRMVEEISPIETPANIGLVIILTLYFSLSEILTKGSSIGKQLFRMRVYSLRTRQPVTSQITIARALIKTCCIVLFPVGSLGSIFLLGIALLPLFTHSRQTLHDLLTRTVVMDESGMWTRVNTQPTTPV